MRRPPRQDALGRRQTILHPGCCRPKAACLGGSPLERGVRPHWRPSLRRFGLPKGCHASGRKARRTFPSPPAGPFPPPRPLRPKRAGGCPAAGSTDWLCDLASRLGTSRSALPLAGHQAWCRACSSALDREHTWLPLCWPRPGRAFRGARTAASCTGFRATAACACWFVGSPEQDAAHSLTNWLSSSRPDATGLKLWAVSQLKCNAG
jgi:hypothetical protein